MSKHKQFLVYGAPTLGNRGRWVEPIASINKPSDLIKVISKEGFLEKEDDFHRAIKSVVVDEISFIQIVDSHSSRTAYVDIRLDRKGLIDSLTELDTSMERQSPRFIVQYFGRDFNVLSGDTNDPAIAGRDFEPSILDFEYVDSPAAFYESLASTMHRPHAALKRKNYTFKNDPDGRDGIGMTVCGANEFDLFQFLDKRSAGELLVYVSTRTVFSVKIIDLDNEKNWMEFLRVDGLYHLDSISNLIADFSSSLNLKSALSK